MSWFVKIVIKLFSFFTFLLIVTRNKVEFFHNKDDLNIEMEQESILPPELLKAQVKMSDHRNVDEKLKKMAEDGPESLQVIFDFDKTLTKPNQSREPVFSSLEIFQRMDEVPDWYKREMKASWAALDAVLEDRNASIDKKRTACAQTANGYEAKLRQLKVENLPQAIERESLKSIQLREDTKETLNLLSSQSVPVTILSGGLGDAINAVLKKSVELSQIRILSNYLDYSGQTILGFKGEFIHIFNKNEQAMKDSSHSKEIERRQNIILVGDALADANMADGASSTATKLSIGFLNHNVDKYLQDYLKVFDIVIIEDSSMSVVFDLFKIILKQ